MVTKRDLTGIGQFMFMGLIGIIIACRLRNPVRVLVTRSTPMQRRMSDDFFHRLTRVTTPIGIGIALGAAALRHAAAFTWDSVAARHLDLLTAEVERRGRRS